MFPRPNGDRKIQQPTSFPSFPNSSGYQVCSRVESRVRRSPPSSPINAPLTSSPYAYRLPRFPIPAIGPDPTIVSTSWRNNQPIKLGYDSFLTREQEQNGSFQRNQSTSVTANHTPPYSSRIHKTPISAIRNKPWVPLSPLSQPIRMDRSISMIPEKATVKREFEGNLRVCQVLDSSLHYPVMNIPPPPKNQHLISRSSSFANNEPDSRDFERTVSVYSQEAAIMKQDVNQNLLPVESEVEEGMNPNKRMRLQECNMATMIDSKSSSSTKLPEKQFFPSVSASTSTGIQGRNSYTTNTNDLVQQQTTAPAPYDNCDISALSHNLYMAIQWQSYLIRNGKSDYAASVDQVLQYYASMSRAQLLSIQMVIPPPPPPEDKKKDGPLENDSSNKEQNVGLKTESLDLLASPDKMPETHESHPVRMIPLSPVRRENSTPKPSNMDKMIEFVI